MKAHPRKQIAPLAIAALLSLGFGAALCDAAPIVVNSNADNTTAANAQCTLREAITNANADTDGTSGDCAAGSGPDTITFAPTLAGLGIALAGQLPTLVTDITIVGLGPDKSAVRRNTGGNYRIFSISNATVNISGLTISNGNLGTSGSFPVNSGGGIFNDGTMRLADCIISGNSAEFGGGVFNHNNRALYVTNCRIQGNSASKLGGGLYNNSGSSTTIYLTNSTVSGNSADEGAGVYVFSSSALLATNSTISGNTAATEGGGLYNDAGVARFTGVTVTNNRATQNGGGTFANGGNLLLRDTIIAGNFEGVGSTANDIGNGGLDSGSSHNVIGTGGGALAGSNGNQTGVNDPGFGPLAFNSGPTPTHALLPGSPAADAGIAFTTLNLIDASQTSFDVQDTKPFPEGVGFTIQVDNEQMIILSKSGDTLTVTRGANGTTAVAHAVGSAVNSAFDQRGPGFPRVAEGAIDIGAFEARGFVVNTPADIADLDPGDGLCDADAAPGSQCTLRAAIQEAMALDNEESGVKTITFVNPGAGPHTIQLTGPLPDLSQSVNILNKTGQPITVRRDTGGEYRIFFVGSAANATISGLELTNGKAATGDANTDFGGAIRNEGTLLLTKMWIHGNAADLSSGLGYGGGIFNTFTLTAIACTFSDNDGTSGGGMANAGTARVTNCTFSNNTAGERGGAIINENTGLLIVTGSTVATNSASTSEGGIFNNSGLATIRDTIVADNVAPAKPDVSGVASGGFNLVENSSTFSPASGDITGADPNLGPLQDNGGPTPTRALLGGSPAIDAGRNFATDANDNPILKDQRGFQRPVDRANSSYPNPADGSDIGAFEVQSDADITRVNVTIEQAPGQQDPTVASPIRFMAEFDHGVIGFDGSDVAISGNAGATTANVIPVSPTTYKINVAGMTQNGKVIVNLPANAAFNDVTGSGNAPSTSNDNSVTYSATDAAATFRVNSTADSDDGVCSGGGNQDCTLREAIDAANADKGAETITFAPALMQSGPARLKLKRALPDIASPMTITGPGAKLFDISRSDAEGTPAFRIFSVKPGVAATIKGIAISNGDARPLGNGGGILNRGTLSILGCRLHHNLAAMAGTGGAGGAIATDGSLMVKNSTLEENSAKFGGGIEVLHGPLSVASSTFRANRARSGGAIHSKAGAKVVNSTFSKNAGTDGGGGIMSDSGSTLLVANCTFSGNTGQDGGGLLVNAAGVTVGNTIFKTSSGGNSIELSGGGNFHSAGYNLSSDAAGGNSSTAPGGLLNNTGDQRNTEPKLGALANNGGPTLTYAPADNSQAIDKGKDLARDKNKQPLGKDQRGQPRPVRFDTSIVKPPGGDGSDIGAVERAAPPPP